MPFLYARPAPGYWVANRASQTASQSSPSSASSAVAVHALTRSLHTEIVTVLVLPGPNEGPELEGTGLVIVCELGAWSTVSFAVPSSRSPATIYAQPSETANAWVRKSGGRLCLPPVLGLEGAAHANVARRLGGLGEKGQRLQLRRLPEHLPLLVEQHEGELGILFRRARVSGLWARRTHRGPRLALLVGERKRWAAAGVQR